MIFDDSRNVCCFSGHRPEKLPDGGNPSSMNIRRLKSVLMLAVEEAVAKGKTVFLSGMARGVDLWAAAMVIEAKRKNPEIKLVCVLPYRDQMESVKGVEKWQYCNILENADETVVLCEKRTKGCYRKRNEFLVSHSSMLIAVVWNYSSGTGQTIKLAEKKGLETHIIDINENKEIFCADDSLPTE